MPEIRIPFFKPSIDAADVEAVAESLRSGWLTSGPNVKELECEIAGYTGAKFVNAVNSCTAALHLALRGWGIGEGDEVITTPYTFAATATVVFHAGAVPVFVDVRDSDANIDPERIEQAITPRTKAIIPVDFAGEPCEMDAIMDIARRHGLKVLSDAAHSVGSMYRGRPVGSIADATAFSFYATKNMTTGEGGALSTNDEELSDRVRRLTLHGITKDGWNRYAAGGTWRYDIAEFGFKDNLTDLAASLGRKQLARLDEFNEKRAKLVQRYFANLRDEEHLILPGFNEANQRAWHLLMVRVKNEQSPVKRDQVIEQLSARGIQTSVHFIPLHYFSAYKQTGRWKEGDFPVAERIFDGAISLPLFPDMTMEQVDEVCGALKEILHPR